jgi:hypothetical protein
MIFWLIALSLTVTAGALWAVEQGFKPARPAESATPAAKKTVTPPGDVPKDIDSPRERAIPAEAEDSKDAGLEKDNEKVPEKAPAPTREIPPAKPEIAPEKTIEKAPEKPAAEEPKTSLPRMGDKEFLEALDRQVGELSRDLKQHNQHSDAKSLTEFRQLLQSKDMQNYLRKLSAEEQRVLLNLVGVIANQRSKMAMLAKQLMDKSLGESTPATAPAAPAAPAPQYIAEITELIIDVALINAGEDKGLKAGEEVLVYRQGKVLGTGVIKIVRANVAQVALDPLDENVTVQKGDKIALRK